MERLSSTEKTSPNRTCLYFVRHAHSVYSADEYGRPLSERGYQDAQRVTEILKTENINRILSSPYRRAIETVEGISRFLGIEIERKEDFKERVVASHPVEDFALAMAKLWGDEQFAWPGGESNQTARARGVHAVKRVLETYPGENIVIATHGNLMVLTMNQFDSRYDFSFWKQLAMPDVYKLTFEGMQWREARRLWVPQ